MKGVIEIKGSVRQRKSGKFEYYFDVGKDENGKRKKVSKGGFKTEKDARVALEKALEEFENKGSVYKHTNMSMAQLLDYYMNNHVKLNCAARTIERYEQVIQKHINPALGHYYIRNIDAKLIKKFLDEKYNLGYAKKTIDLLFTLVKHPLKIAVQQGFLKENPAQNVSLRYKYNYTKDRELTREQLYIVLNFLQENNYEYYVLFALAWGTGMRRSEILGLTWKDIDFDKKIINVRQQQQYLNKGKHRLVDPKTKSSIRDIIIGDKMVALLKKHKDFVNEKNVNHNFVMINTKGDWMKKHNVANIYKKIRDELGFNVGLHDIRHLHGTVLCQEKANIKGIQQRLGHSNIQTTLNTYVKTTEKIKKDTANILESVL